MASAKRSLTRRASSFACSGSNGCTPGDQWESTWTSTPAASIAALPPAAPDARQQRVEVRVINCYDGDTCTLAGTAGVRPDGAEHVPTGPLRVRIRGVDAPEIRGQCPAEADLAREARDFTTAFLATGAVLLVTRWRTDRYGRLLADFRTDRGLLSEALLTRGLAHPYDGGRRRGWC